MPTKTSEAWGLTDQRIFYVQHIEEHDGWRLWSIPGNDGDATPFVTDEISGVVDAVRFIERNYPNDAFEGVMVRYDNGAQLNITNEQPDDQFRPVIWRLDNTGLPETPHGSRLESLNRPFADSVENILDGAPAMWVEMDGED